MSTAPHASSAAPLKVELKVTDAAAFSVGLIGPVGVMALLGAGAAGLLGQGAAWAFVFALVAVSLVAYGFVRLSRHISHTGSVYALVGITLGPRAGFVAGWALFGAYLAIGAGSGVEIGLFLGELLRGLGLDVDPDWAVVAVVALVLVAVLGRSEVRVITRSLLIAELIGAALVTLLSVAILARLATGNAPGSQSIDLEFLALPSGTDVGLIAAAAVFGFLAFAGFEGAATLGEETANPRAAIPKAIKIAIAVVGVFYLLTITAQSLGFGTDEAGVAAFTSSASPYGDLAGAYVGPWLAVLLNLAAVLSLFAILLGTVSAAARILFALGRDSGGTRGIARVSPGGAPVVALTVSLVVALAIVVGLRFTGAAVLDATFWALTVGTISLLVAYVLATVGAIRFLFLGGARRAPSWQVVVPVLALALVLYTIYRNAVGLEAPYSWFPYVVAVWLLIGLAVVALVPGLGEQVRAHLQRADADASARLDAASTDGSALR